MTTNARRKALIALCAGGLAAALPALAQQPVKVWRVGFLNPNSPSDLTNPLAALVAGMKELGYVEGRNLAIEARYSAGKVEALPALVDELLRLKVDVLVTGAIAPTRAAQAKTTTIPIVMVNVGDPVGSGLVKSLARPGGNLTGLSNISTDTPPKHLELLLRLQPRLSRVAMLVVPGNPLHEMGLSYVRNAAQARKVSILPVEARTPAEMESAFARMARESAGALIIASDPIYAIQFPRIAVLSAKGRLPAVSGNLEYARSGGLMSYGADIAGNYHRAATYVDKIFKGAKPAELPVEEPTKLELLLNRKAAKAIGLAIPQDLLLSADRVIE